MDFTLREKVALVTGEIKELEGTAMGIKADVTSFDEVEAMVSIGRENIIE